MKETLTILDQFAIRRCDLFGCDRPARFRLRNHHICDFHHTLLLYGRGLVEYLRLENEKESKDENFGLGLEDEEELGTPGETT
jgi:hypothetical protein